MSTSLVNKPNTDVLLYATVAFIEQVLLNEQRHAAKHPPAQDKPPHGCACEGVHQAPVR